MNFYSHRISVDSLPFFSDLWYFILSLLSFLSLLLNSHFIYHSFFFSPSFIAIIPLPSFSFFFYSTNTIIGWEYCNLKKEKNFGEDNRTCQHRDIMAIIIEIIWLSFMQNWSLPIVSFSFFDVNENSNKPPAAFIIIT